MPKLRTYDGVIRLTVKGNIMTIDKICVLLYEKYVNKEITFQDFLKRVESLKIKQQSFEF